MIDENLDKSMGLVVKYFLDNRKNTKKNIFFTAEINSIFKRYRKNKCG
ncbi:hypothetical protein DFQ07_0713 [Tenacibaculum caenipelagi]|uniref:Uncharacterized protein n=1 Tax=Tenacibaculum caenipelagi TaxID=1325435 RepID=A0A4R6TMR6_9FLAO|nr:hypothetical protein DFQ07_0713 [Tenacibaculum caenipelagi]